MRHHFEALALTWRLTKGNRGLLVVGLFGLLTVNLLGLLPPYALGLLVDSVHKGTASWSPLTIALGYIAVFVIQAVVRYPMRLGFEGMAAQVTSTIRKRYADHLLRIPSSDLALYLPGDLINRAASSLGAVESALSTGLLFFLGCVLSLISIPVAMILLSPRLSILGFAALPIIPIVAHRMIPRIAGVSQETQEAFGLVNSHIQENAVGAQTIRAYGLEERESAILQSKVKTHERLDLLHLRKEAEFTASVQAVIAIALSVVLWSGGREAIGGRITTGQLMTFFQYMGMMAWPLSGLAWAWVLFEKGKAGYSEIETILQIPLSSEKGERPFSPLRWSIEIKNLTYSYRGRSEPTLHELSIVIRSGERVAIIGPNGAGKSTLLKLLTRIIDPPAGTIWIDGVDVTTLDLNSIREEMAVVPEVPFLFSGTIRENVGFGILADSEVEQAGREGQVSGDEFHLGLETEVGQRGQGLSGGQRQRVILARAFARKAGILILDDGSSSLDWETEDQVYQAMWKRSPGTTILFATHRIARAGWADRIIVLEGGRIREEGAPKELLSGGGMYAGWVERQAFSLGDARG